MVPRGAAVDGRRSADNPVVAVGVRGDDTAPFVRLASYGAPMNVCGIVQGWLSHPPVLCLQSARRACRAGWKAGSSM